ncbi:MAG TPA: hypothetical protein VE084_00505 [Burkholderiaceae bacterium]|nr:hypothetical protein [Burkholderiaceae bacterium]
MFEVIVTSAAVYLISCCHLRQRQIRLDAVLVREWLRSMGKRSAASALR